MYKIRTSNIPSIDRHPQFFIRRSEIAFDERARFVEFVCNVWNEGRFGPDRTAPVTVNFSDRPECEPTAFYDLPDGDPIALTTLVPLTPLGRAGDQKIEAALKRAKQIGLLDAGPNGGNPASASIPNQGRGSP